MKLPAIDLRPPLFGAMFLYGIQHHDEPESAQWLAAVLVVLSIAGVFVSSARAGEGARPFPPNAREDVIS